MHLHHLGVSTNHPGQHCHIQTQLNISVKEIEVKLVNTTITNHKNIASKLCIILTRIVTN